MAKPDPNIAAHLEWIGFVRPTGLVVSATALDRAGAILDRRDVEGQRLLCECAEERRFVSSEAPQFWLPDFRAFASAVLGWSFSPKGYAGTDEAQIPADLKAALSDSGGILRPDIAVRMEPLRSAGDAPSWQLLVQVCEPREDFDRVTRARDGLEASPHGRMERLLRHTGVPAGLLFNGLALRLISSPRGESSGWLDFRVADMVQTAGRPISTAMRLLLHERRLLSLPRPQRLAALLEDSRKYQNEVSERLARQVLHALYELLRGFQAAHDLSGRKLLEQPLEESPDEVYRGLLTLVLRLVFLLYAEERDMLPQDAIFLRAYSLAALHARLREDAALHPDTMDQRYGAYAQLLVLFRMVHDGARSGAMALPPRHGALFDPDRYRFLEGRGAGGARQIHERVEPPWVPDGTIYRVLEKLLVLDGERISYRALDVEHIGSVYETMMGFRLEAATGRSAAIRAAKKHGAPATVDIEALLGEAPASRARWIQDRTDRKLTDRVKQAVREADNTEALHAALDTVIDRDATPDLVPEGAIVLQPSEERRRSGSHYTPRELTEPIVREALEPVLARLRADASGPPTPGAILELKVCDPAMGSGAFLVEMCRQLADALVEAWRAHDAVPEIPVDENEFVYARRQVAQRCLYGVDRNPVAVDLAKLSLWLITLAKDHPLTFLDHALRQGDSLVGLTTKQLEAFHWDRAKPPMLRGIGLRDALDTYSELRQQIRRADDSVPDWRLRSLWNDARFELDKARLVGDLVVAAFFDANKPRERTAMRDKYASAVLDGSAAHYRDWIQRRRAEDPPLAPFHWEMEFPEVFDTDNPGFNVIVGNPPFQGGRNITASLGDSYSSWLRGFHEGSNGGADLVAHFFRRAFDLICKRGTLGLIATNTVAQGDTRASGLRWICAHGGQIFSARKSVAWPGQAAVVISVLHIAKEAVASRKRINGREVERITAFLFHRGGHDDPVRLAANGGKSFQGSIVLGMGFTFDDTDKKGAASPLDEMRRLVARDPGNREVIFPYIGGREVNASPTHAGHRYVIDFGERSESECRRRWPELMEIVEGRVRPERAGKDARKYPRMVNQWWKHWNPRPELRGAIAGLQRVLVVSRVSNSAAFTFVPAPMVYADSLVVFPSTTYAAFSVLQSRVHEVWIRFFGSSMKDDLRYTPSDCFETFPLPDMWDTLPALEAAGREYYMHRAGLMRQRNEGLTTVYNQFHAPDVECTAIRTLRALHSRMDKEVLAAFGWTDIQTGCEFESDLARGMGSGKNASRYRWSEETRDEVLARLIALNEARGIQEARSGLVVHRETRV